MRVKSAGKSVNQEVHFIESEAGTQSFQFTTPAVGGGFNFYCGSSQFGLTYNDQDNKVEIDSLHLPLLDVSNASATNKAGGLPEIRAYSAGAPLRPFFVNKHSGVFIVSV